MYHDAYPLLRRARRLRRRRRLALTAFTAALGVAAWTGLRSTEGDHVLPLAGAESAEAPARGPEQVAPSRRYGWMLDPTLVLGASAPTWGEGSALGATFTSDSTRFAAAAEPLAPPAVDARVRIAPAPVQATARLVQTIPLPVARPSEFRPTRSVEPVRMAARPVRTQTVFRAAIGDDRSFLETLFGIDPPKNTLAYAAVDTDAVASSPRRRAIPTPSLAIGSGTAVYDISARTVHLPNGESIEAHSGLGGSMDDPRYVHLRMRGATPPGTYDLTEREQLFHGVRAIRLNPVGGSGAIHGRDGLLAHTYMLGPSGASNGCVSFKNYNVFLQAYLRGEIRRLVVVAGTLQDGPPGTRDRRIGLSDRPDPRASGG